MSLFVDKSMGESTVDIFMNDSGLLLRLLEACSNSKMSSVQPRHHYNNNDCFCFSKDEICLSLGTAVSSGGKGDASVVVLEKELR